MSGNPTHQDLASCLGPNIDQSARWRGELSPNGALNEPHIASWPPDEPCSILIQIFCGNRD